MHQTVAAVFALMLGGCLALPVPNSRVEGYGLDSRVVDSDTAKPIPGAEVTMSNGRRADAGADGAFHIGPHVQIHFGYLLSPISYPIWPFTGDAIAETTGCSISAPGYQSAEFEIWPRNWVARYPAGRVTGNLGGDGTFVVSSLALKKGLATTKPE